MEIKNRDLGGVACDVCREFAMLIGGELPPGWGTVTLEETGAELDICPACNRHLHAAAEPKQ